MKTFLMVAASTFVLSVAMASAQGTTAAVAPANPVVPAETATAPTDVPVGIALPAIPTGNHYVCYPARSTAQFKPRGATFRDQFGVWTATVVGITRICTPAEKRANNRVYPMVNRNLHLTCYAIRSPARAPSVVTNDQFGARRLILSPATEVCLPAGKIPLKS